MTEELRKEATTTVQWECTPMIDRHTFMNGYITEAESREKRIIELEQQIEKMKNVQNCNYGYDGQYENTCHFDIHRNCNKDCKFCKDWVMRKE